MQPLEKTLRGQLERTVKQARDIAEAAARDAIGQLGVGELAPFAHLSDDERNLRKKLRVHGRQLGDLRNAKGEQETFRLVEETAYEHWHRMLFARFLAENNLLMYDGVAVTLEECEELAPEDDANNGWELAALLAAKMLPQIFRPDSPAFQLHFAANHQLPLEKLLAELPQEVFSASDSLGWVYQFWQAKKKDEVNASEVKIGARELPAVTQLFTEPYMVSSLLDNSLGAWWAARRLTEADLKNAQNEKELRRKAAIPGVPLDYLRFVQLENGSWTPAAGTFDDWPEQFADLKTLDPCCGSGHFLVAAFLMLVPMRMECDGLSAKDAVDAVLRENIHGLELDQRCVELAAFALALAAWKYLGAGGYRILPELNVACSGLSISTKRDEWLALAGENTDLRLALEELYRQFSDAPVLGSLISPEASLGKGSLFELKWDEVGPLLKKALTETKDDEKAEMGVVAHGLLKTATILNSKYTLAITNVPYLGQGKQVEVVRGFVDRYYPAGKFDIAAAFILRIFGLLDNGGTCSVVSPQNWQFLNNYRHLREYLVRETSIDFIALLGAGAFSSISGEVVKVGLTVGSKKEKDGFFHAIDLSESQILEAKSNGLISDKIIPCDQKKQLSNPDCRFILSGKDYSTTLIDFADSYEGIGCGDLVRFSRNYWETIFGGDDWVPLRGTTEGPRVCGGVSSILYWQNGSGDIYNLAMELKDRLKNTWQRGKQAWSRVGVAINRMGDYFPEKYLGEIFDSNIAAVIPKKEEYLLPIWCFVNSPEYKKEIREIDKSLKITNVTFLKVPFDIAYWTTVAKEQYPHGLPNPYSNDPSQWAFHGYPCGSVVWDEDKKWTAFGRKRTDEDVLQVAVARLLGYRWPAELDNKIDLAEEQREWVTRCETLLPYADDDGIVCIPAVRGEASADDRLLNLLAAAYEDEWSNNTLAALLASVGYAGKTLETWLREKFFTQHCKLFQHRPFIWHIWDGLRDGFAALVNYHKLDHKLLETLIYTYLGDWITRQKQDIASGIDGAQEKLAAAESLKEKLELILEGEAPYDIFVRWKPLDQQPIGWNPDLNDGVRLNIRPFLTVPDVGKKGAGVLRDKPNIKWGKDRGKDVESAPWYYLGLEYGGSKGDRINDHHLTLAEKKVARETGK